MKIFLDDVRSPPSGWILAQHPDDVINYIKSGQVEEISLDHDLGLWNDCGEITGMKVLEWLEEKVYFDKTFIPPKITLHTANSVARKRMEQAIKNIIK